MKKFLGLAFLVLIFTSCANEMYYEPFIVTGIEPVSVSMSNYYEKGQDKYTMENIVLAPKDKYQIGDTIPEASMRYK